MITVEYISSNSGGNWWLKDEDWHALEQAGWKVEWLKGKKSPFGETYKDGRWLGALAKEASFECETPDEAIASFQQVTGLDPWAEGCNCCGKPHYFSYTDAEGNHHSAQTEVVSIFSGWS